MDSATVKVIPDVLALRLRTGNFWTLLTIASVFTEERMCGRPTHLRKRGGSEMTYVSTRSLLAIALSLLSVSFPGSTELLGQDANKPVPVPRKETGRLPKVPSVESMLNPSSSIERFLSRTPSQSAYEESAAVPESFGRTNNDQAEWAGSFAGWTAPEFYTRPLYFEQINFERYETSAPAWTRPATSYAKFLSTIPVLPYKMGAHGPRDRIYTIGHYPYGQTAPVPSDWKLSKRGLVLQGAATTGLIFLIP